MSRNEAATGAPDFYLSDRLLTADERAVRDRVREFAERRLKPIAGEAWETATFPRQLLPELAELGIVGGTIQGNGCPGLSSVGYGLALQEIARGDSSVGTFMAVQSSLVMGALAICGSVEQQAAWLPRLARCETIGAFALTEPDHGSDASHLATIAARDGDEYVLNGRKRWIGNAAMCDLAVIWARAENGVTGFLVERPNPGYSATPIAGKLSQRAVEQAEIRLDNCRVPLVNRLERTGFRAVSEVLRDNRHHIAWAALGEALACYEAALGYALTREQFGKPIASFQLIQARLVQMLGEITKAQLLSIQLGRLKDEGLATNGMTSYAKASNSAMAREVARLAREILGGNGILDKYEIMRHLCDIEGVYTYEGTHDILTLVTGREITGLAAF